MEGPLDPSPASRSEETPGFRGAGRTRTCDLQAMNLTSCQLLYSAPRTIQTATLARKHHGVLTVDLS